MQGCGESLLFRAPSPAGPAPMSSVEMVLDLVNKNLNSLFPIKEFTTPPAYLEQCRNSERGPGRALDWCIMVRSHTVSIHFSSQFYLIYLGTTDRCRKSRYSAAVGHCRGCPPAGTSKAQKSHFKTTLLDIKRLRLAPRSSHNRHI